MATPLPRTQLIDPMKEIQDNSIRDRLARAAHHSRKTPDSPEAREPLANQAQDLLMALRDLKVGYNAHAVHLSVNLGTDPTARGDLFVYGQPCHPRDVAEKLVAGGDVGGLLDLVNDLEAKLDYEAGPDLVAADKKK